MLPILDEVEHVKLYARQIRDRELLAEASEFQMRAERRLGIVITAGKAAGHFTEGRRKKPINGTESEPFPSATLEDVGVDKKLSARAQKQSSLAEQAFENVVRAHRQRIASGKATFVDAQPVCGARSIAPTRAEAEDSLDYFPTPPWATRALMERVMQELGIESIDIHSSSAWEPACGEGHIAEVLREYFSVVHASDIFDYGYGDGISDFLSGEAIMVAAEANPDWIITNPPFGELTENFVLTALNLAGVGVAMFVRLQWLESVGRYEAIFRDHPPTIVSFFAERVPLCKGRWDPDGTTATAYIWLVWIEGAPSRAPFWIPPGCRAALTKPDDRERFTTTPVTKRPTDAAGNPVAHDESGEVITPNRENALTPAPAEALPDIVDIPEFLRRDSLNRVPVLSPRVVDSASVGEGHG